MSGDVPHSGQPKAVFRGTVQDDHGHRLPAMVRVFQGESPRFNRHVEGGFAFELAPGSYRIEVTVDGYPPQQFKITLASRSGAAHTFVMRRHIGNPDEAGLAEEKPSPKEAPPGPEKPEA